MKERAPGRYRPPEHIQTSFLAPEEAQLYAEFTRLRLLMERRFSRAPRGPDGEPTIIRSPRDVVALLQPEMEHLTQEEFRAVLLNAKNHVLDIPTLYKGTLNSSPVRIAEVYKPAILANAAAIIPVHNHPSGDPTPSPEDVRVTAELVRAGQLLDIECLDHLIIGRGQYASLKERGLGFT
jgi:DNA repair protein RadC